MSFTAGIKNAGRKAFKAAMWLSLAVTVLVVASAAIMYYKGMFTEERTQNAVLALKGVKPVEKDHVQAPVDDFADAVRKQNDIMEKTLVFEEKMLKMEKLESELNTKATQIEQERNKLRADIALFEEEKTKYRMYIEDTLSKMGEANFESNVKIYAKMDAVETADILSTLSSRSAVLYLRAFKEAYSAEVLTEMRKAAKEKATEVEAALEASTSRPK